MNTYTEQASAAPEIYSLNDVSRCFGKGKDELQVLSGVDLTLREGEIVGMLGRSGSGKSQPVWRSCSSEQDCTPFRRSGSP